MSDFKIGKREMNRSRLKIDIMRAFINALETHELNNLRIQDVCDIIGISKVTFFNYFDAKEEVVEYFIHLWQFELSYKLDQSKKTGMEQLYLLFDSIGDHPASKSIMNAFMSYFIKIDNYNPVYISDYELYLFNKEAYEKGYRRSNIFELVNKCLVGFDNTTEEKEKLIRNILIGLYGGAFIQNLGFANNMKNTYREFIDTMLY